MNTGGSAAARRESCEQPASRKAVLAHAARCVRALIRARSGRTRARSRRPSATTRSGAPTAALSPTAATSANSDRVGGRPSRPRPPAPPARPRTAPAEVACARAGLRRATLLRAPLSCGRRGRSHAVPLSAAHRRSDAAAVRGWDARDGRRRDVGRRPLRLGLPPYLPLPVSALCERATASVPITNRLRPKLLSAHTHIGHT